MCRGVNVSLLDEAREKASKYITPKDFLCCISYKLEEPIEDVASFLLHNYFDEEACEYYIDRHYRIYPYDDISCEYKTSTLLQEITKDGFFNYMMFCNNFFDDCPNIDSDLDFYTPVRIDFYYSIDALEKLPFIKELNLDLKNASSLDYTVYSDDTVKAEKSKDERLFQLIDLRGHVTIEDIKPSIKEYGYHSQVDVFEEIITDKIPAPTIIQTEPKSDKELIVELQAKVANLENQLVQATSELTDKPADYKELAPNSQAKVTHMLYAILKEHRYDLSPPKGKGVANDQIVAASRSHKSPVTRNFVANWLERVHQLDIELKK